jgi:hypothetical protein
MWLCCAKKKRPLFDETSFSKIRFRRTKELCHNQLSLNITTGIMSMCHHDESDCEVEKDFKEKTSEDVQRSGSDVEYVSMSSACFSSTSPSQLMLSSASEDYRRSPFHILDNDVQQSHTLFNPVIHSPSYLEYFYKKKAPDDVRLSDLPACNRYVILPSICSLLVKNNRFDTLLYGALYA